MTANNHYILDDENNKDDNIPKSEALKSDDRTNEH